MIVPEYWAEAREQARHKGRVITVRRYGWSDDSVDAAMAVVTIHHWDAELEP